MDWSISGLFNSNLYCAGDDGGVSLWIGGINGEVVDASGKIYSGGKTAIRFKRD